MKVPSNSSGHGRHSFSSDSVNPTRVGKYIPYSLLIIFMLIYHVFMFGPLVGHLVRFTRTAFLCKKTMEQKKRPKTPPKDRSPASA